MALVKRSEVMRCDEVASTCYCKGSVQDPVAPVAEKPITVSSTAGDEIDDLLVGEDFQSRRSIGQPLVVTDLTQRPAADASLCR